MLLNWNTQNFKCQFFLNWAMVLIKKNPNRILKNLKTLPKLIWNCQSPRLVKTSWKRKPGVEGLALPGTEPYCHSGVTQTVIFILGYGGRKTSLVFFNIWVFPLSRHLADSSSGPLTGKILWSWQMSCKRKWMNDGWCFYAESVKNSTGNLSVSTLCGECSQWSNHFTSCRWPPWCISCITCDLLVKES